MLDRAVGRASHDLDAVATAACVGDFVVTEILPRCFLKKSSPECTILARLSILRHKALFVEGQLIVEQDCDWHAEEPEI